MTYSISSFGSWTKPRNRDAADRNDTIAIRPDGAFTTTDASFNPLQGRDADSFVTFRSGALRFQDAEGLIDIEFWLVDDTAE